MEPGHYYETAVDKAIREAQERGAFEDLPGKGKPLRGLDTPHDDNWWLNDWMKREGVSMEALLPPSVQLRKEVDRLPATLRPLPTEDAVRDVIAELNGRILDHMRFPSGPAVPIRRVDTEEMVRRWRNEHPAPTERTAPAPPPQPEPEPRRRWWQRR